MNTYTPAPWNIKPDRKLGQDIKIIWETPYHNTAEICHLSGSGFLPDKNNWEGNAQLISAAPDLLEALESLFENCEMIHRHWGEGSNQREADAAIAAAHAAVAKARGIK